MRWRFGLTLTGDGLAVKEGDGIVVKERNGLNPILGLPPSGYPPPPPPPPPHPHPGGGGAARTSSRRGEKRDR